MTRVPYVCDGKAYREHYGRGLPTFHGEIIQQGYGIGNLLGGFFKSLIPLASKHVAPILKKSAASAGKSLLRSGANVIKEVALEKKNLKDSLKRHAKTSLEDILQDVVGGQKGRGLRCKKTKRLRKSKKSSKDIFS